MLETPAFLDLQLRDGKYLLNTLVDIYPQTAIVLDALDEADEEKARTLHRDVRCACGVGVRTSKHFHIKSPRHRHQASV
jgi:hypothetical protein